MTRESLNELEHTLMELVANRRKLGGFDTNAAAILVLGDALLKITMHLQEKERPKKKRADADAAAAD